MSVWILPALRAARIQSVSPMELSGPGSNTYSTLTWPASTAARRAAGPSGVVAPAAPTLYPRSRAPRTFGASVGYASGVAVRDAIARELSALRGYAALSTMTFSRPMSAQHWLQTSNPSERWKWDFMFQDLPPIKFGEEFGPLPRADVFPLREVK